MNNIYDDDNFFNRYAQMTRSRQGLSGAGEWHQLKDLFPDLTGKTVLDLGCGYGWHCRYAVECGADRVLGIDLSKKMIHSAKEKNHDPRITYAVMGLDDYDYPADTFNCVISNLVLHYMEDLDTIYRKIFGTLKAGGCFLLNIEHPVFTAGVNEDWIYDDGRKPLYWPVDRYFYPGERTTHFLGENVVKQHHTLTQILMGLIKAGFLLEAVEEAVPNPEMLDIPGMADEMRRPMMLMVKALKPDRE
ncbi:MAG: class I SAM-dependent methyltransferase [Lacrimispora sp.]